MKFLIQDFQKTFLLLLIYNKAFTVYRLCQRFYCMQYLSLEIKKVNLFETHFILLVGLQVYAFSLFIYPLISVIQKAMKLSNTVTYHFAIT